MEGERGGCQGETQSAKPRGLHLTHHICREVAQERSAFMKAATAAQQEPYEILSAETHQNLPPLSQVMYALLECLFQANYRL